MNKLKYLQTLVSMGEELLKQRATTEQQKREVIERLYTAWLKMPDLRLGQLIGNTKNHFNQNRTSDLDKHMDFLFYIEDFGLVKEIESFINQQKLQNLLR